MIYILDNFLAILGATSVALVLGLIGLRMAKGFLPNAGSLLVVFAAEFWMACILAGALILAPTDEAPRWVMTLATPFVIWLGFVVPVTSVLGAFNELSARSTLRASLHWLVVMLAMAGTLQAIGLVAPNAG